MFQEKQEASGNVAGGMGGNLKMNSERWQEPILETVTQVGSHWEALGGRRKGSDLLCNRSVRLMC